jgi:hypothetical protein
MKFGLFGGSKTTGRFGNEVMPEFDTAAPARSIARG